MAKRKDIVAELRELDEDALEEKIAASEQELMSLRFRHASRQLEQTSQLTVLRKQIGRMKTIQQQKKAAEAANA